MKMKVQILYICIVVSSATKHAIIFPGETTSDTAIYDDLEIHEISSRFSGPQGGRCVTPSGERRVCIPLPDCPELRRLYTRNGFLSSRAFITLRSRVCRVDNNRNVFFCCAAPPSVNPAVPNIVSATGGPISSQQSSLIPSLSECGTSSGRRIVNGKEITPHSHPWLVSLGSQSGTRYNHLCGGSLITKRHIISAGHCFITVRGVPPITHARLGEHSLSKEERFGNIITSRIIRKTSPGYNRQSQENDLELLELERDIEFDSNIKPVCLPFHLLTESFDGEALTVVGWGDTFHKSNQRSDVPLGADVPIVPKSQCQQAYSRQTEIVIDNRQICAGDGGEDACQGDSGGPLIFTDPGKRRQYLVGLVSFGVECAREDFPGIYTFIPQFLNWIQANL